MEYYSPLRYPGGKASFTSFLDDVILLNDLQGCKYYEPYAGGAGAALGLLMSGAVSELFLNDADIRIFAFWRSLLTDSDRFIETIQSVHLTIDEWYRQKEINQNPDKFSLYEVGFSTFFLNRCNHSGVLNGGPIGGIDQKGKWKIDARFHRENLKKRILNIRKISPSIHISQMDAIEFLQKIIREDKGCQNLIYLDPPYVVKSRDLYMDTYQEKDHIELSEFITSHQKAFWIMSYDYSDFIFKLYANKCNLQAVPIQYSLQNKRQTLELLISPWHLHLPTSYRKGAQRFLLEPIFHENTHI